MSKNETIKLRKKLAFLKGEQVMKDYSLMSNAVVRHNQGCGSCRKFFASASSFA